MEHTEGIKRETWGSRIGFILTTSGAAIGLGNIQRFPYLVAENGGAIFVFLYLLCVLLVALPLILVEFSIGRYAQKNPVAAIRAISAKKGWQFIGFLGILTAFFILSYYSVATGWTVLFAKDMLLGNTPNFQSITEDGWSVFLATALMMFFIAHVVRKGVKSGIERCSKILMPLLAFFLLILIVRVIFLPNSSLGFAYYLQPDFSEVTPRMFVYAIGQAFFSLCIGEAVLITYGSYANKQENLVTSALSVALFDTLVAISAGLIIFPAVFSLGSFSLEEGGVGLIFDVMPQVFSGMPLGTIFGAMFFVILAFAAFTTCISLLEMPVVYLMEERGWSRKKAANRMAFLAFLISIPCMLSKGAVSYFSEYTLFGLKEKGIYELMDFVWGGLGMVVTGFFLAIFVGWVWGADKAADELQNGAPGFKGVYRSVWKILVRYVAPIVILSIFLGMI